MNKDRTEYFKKYREEHKDEAKARSHKSYLLNKEKVLERTKQYYIDNKEKHNQWTKDNYQKNKEEIQVQHRDYYQKNKVQIKKIRNQRIEENPELKLRKNLRRRLHHALKGENKSDSIVKLIGCSFEELKQYLESQFKEGMSWENYGTGWFGKGMQEWHIDHIKPCAKFDLIDPKQQKECFNYKNLQPLWAEENLIKNHY